MFHIKYHQIKEMICSQNKICTDNIPKTDKKGEILNFKTSIL